MPYIESFGDDTNKSLSNRIDLTSNKEKYTEIISEYEKTIISLNKSMSSSIRILIANIL